MARHMRGIRRAVSSQEMWPGTSFMEAAKTPQLAKLLGLPGAARYPSPVN